MTHPAVAAHLADPENIGIVENYYEPETAPVVCNGCRATETKSITDHVHYYPDDWTQLVITGRGDIIGKHYCSTCSDALIRALP